MSTKKMDRWAWLAGWLLVCQAGIVGAAAAAVEHPRLLITPERVAVIRRKIQEKHPHYLWHYDRETGRFAKRLSGEYQFDSHRGNTPFSMIFYPDNVKAKDPTGRFPKMVYDSHGFWFLRNRWKDPDDILVAILGDIKPNAGWNNQEQLNIRLMAFDTMFFGGLGKTKTDSNQSTLLVDGRFHPKGKGHIPGKSQRIEVK